MTITQRWMLHIGLATVSWPYQTPHDGAKSSNPTNTHAVLPYQTDGAIDALMESGGFTLCSLEFYTNASLLLDLTSRMNNCSLSEEHFETTLKLQSLHCISRPLKIQTVHVPPCVLHSVFAIKLDCAHQSIKIKGSACRSNIPQQGQMLLRNWRVFR